MDMMYKSGLAAMAGFLIVQATNGIRDDIDKRAALENVSQFSQKPSDGLRFQSPNKNEGILSVKFSQSEAKELSALLSDEKAMARVFVERLAISMSTEKIDRMQILDEAFKGTFKMNRENDGNIDGVNRTYQIFKTAFARMEKESQNKSKNADAAQTLSPEAQTMIYKRTSAAR